MSTDLTADPGLGKAFYPVLPGSVVINAADSAVCSATDQLGNPRVGTCDIGAIEFQGRTQVSIDIRPRSDANRVNPQSNKNLNVAILSGNGFDATTVDSNLIRFGANGTEAVPVHLAERDVNRDGQRDLVVRFQLQNLGIECGDTSVTLSAQTLTGQAIIGSDSITTIGCKPKKGK